MTNQPTRRITGWLASNRDDLQTGGALLATVLLLAYTFWHSGNLLSRYIDPAWVGYVAALGVEVAIVSLSLRIGQLGWHSPQATIFKRTLIAALVVSALANIAEGHQVMYHQPLTLYALSPLVGNLDGVELATANPVPVIDWIQAAIGLAATGLLSIIVYALADIIGDDVRTATAARRPTVSVKRRASRPLARQPRRRALPTSVAPAVNPAHRQEPVSASPVNPAPTPPMADLDDVSRRLVEALAAAPDGLSKREVARRAGVNPETARQRIDKLEAAGLVSVNGVVKARAVF